MVAHTNQKGFNVGLAAPLVFYQTSNSPQTKRKGSFEKLRTIGGLLDKVAPAETYFSRQYTGDTSRYLHRDSGGVARVYQEEGQWYRPTLCGILKQVGNGKVGVLVPDLDRFLDCSPYIVAAVARLNQYSLFQVLTLEFPKNLADSRIYAAFALSAKKVGSFNDPLELEQELLWHNSYYCQSVIETRLATVSKGSNAISEFKKNTSITSHEGIMGWLDDRLAAEAAGYSAEI